MIRWTESEISDLTAMTERGLSARQMMAYLDRTETAIIAKRAVINGKRTNSGRMPHAHVKFMASWEAPEPRRNDDAAHLRLIYEALKQARVA